ncbi:MAG: MaoC/PaaZ C-terminal domain-containing protein [Herpetosiphon sp.]
MITTWYDDIAIGDRITTGGRTVTEADLLHFAMLTGDWYPLHTDDTYAQQSRYGRRIAHGLLVLSYTMGLARLTPPFTLAFYGIDRVRFLRPTFIGDTIHVIAEATEKTPRDGNAGRVHFAVTVHNQRDEPVLAATMLWLVARQPVA